MKNWKTTLFGILSTLALGISVNPTMVWDWFPKEEFGNLGWNIIRTANICVFVFGGITASVMKDRNVTGGTVATTPEAEARVEGDK